MDSLDPVRALYLELNGDHPMTAEDDDYVRRLFVPLAPDDPVRDLILARRLPSPSYLLADGTLMVHPGYLDNLETAGDAEQIKPWFFAHWSEAGQDEAADEWESYLSGQYVCLYEVTPHTIQSKTRLIELIKELVERLESGAGDDVREQLRGAVDELDALEPPFAPHYDRLRFGGPSSREVWIDDVRATHLQAATL
jgi:hypothetical protein